MRTPTVVSAFALAVFALGCNNTSQPSPDQVRHDTAVATATVAGDIKGAAEGIRDGLHQEVHSSGSASSSAMVNINTASRPDLETLPGIDPTVANLIIHHRPYHSTADLVKKHVLDQAQYDQVAGRVTTN